jgi:isopentenyl-diphosphate Delta-isomerase
MEGRKKEHIELALQSQKSLDSLDKRFDYEPLLAAHPTGLPSFPFLGFNLKAPVWVSSMTGGTKLAATINTNLARACKDFGMGMGLGSCRIILEDDTFFNDFNMRDIIGDELPLYANLGICQIEDIIENQKTDKIVELVKRLRANGLIIHVNPLQEWFQPEGDRLKYPPVETIKRLLDKLDLPIIVKEVGQGMGPESLRELLKLPLAAIEFAAFGGTNFSELERLRISPTLKDIYEPLANIGADASQMLNTVNEIVSYEKNILCNQLIISGGIQSFLDGYYFIMKSKLPAIYGQASSFLRFATEDYDILHSYISAQLKGLEMAYAYLKIK